MKLLFSVGLVVVALAGLGISGSHRQARSASNSVATADAGTIAFQRKVSKAALSIYLMNADGSDQRFLTKGSGFEWSPDRRRIAFLWRSTGTFFDLWVVGRDGRDPRRVVENRLFGELNWSPDGERIAFLGKSGYTSPYSSDIYVVDSGGDNLTRLTMSPLDAHDSAPSWSPDGTRIAFVREDDEGRGRIITIKPTGKDQRILLRGFDLGPAVWSPDGSEIAFEASRGPGHLTDIYRMSQLGKNLRNLTPGTASSGEYRPRWSPNGRMIVFESVGGPVKGGIHRITRDGKNNLTLDTPKTNGEQPSWSPDGRSIVFVSRRDGNHDIYVVTATGRKQTNITNSRIPTQDDAPEWVP